MEKDMNQYLSKAEVLIEALPYIQRFNRKIIVIKYGGSAMMNDELKKNVIADAVLLKLVGFKPIIVHGGGKEISRWVNKVGMEARFVNGQSRSIKRHCAFSQVVTMVRLMLMYYVDFIAFMENPEKTWTDFLAKKIQKAPPETSLFD